MIRDKKIALETARYLLQINAIKLNTKNPFQWTSGWKSPIYCDNRITLSFPEVREHLCNQLVYLARAIYGEKFIVAGVATGAIGIGVLVANAMGLPFLYVRPEPKSHGRKNQIEGQLQIGDKVLVVEDLISTGKSSLGAVRALQDAGADVLGMLARMNMITFIAFHPAAHKHARELLNVFHKLLEKMSGLMIRHGCTLLTLIPLHKGQPLLQL